jgi:heterodisulfide reductase subunit A
MMDAGRHPNIHLLTYSEVESVSGYVGNFTVRIRQRARSVDAEKCTGCGLCQEKCPTRVLDTAYEAGLGYRKAIYRPFAQAVPSVPVIDREHCLFFVKGRCKLCERVCPTEAIDYEQKDEIVEISVGNIILATGFDPFDARRVPSYGYGRYPNVFTSLELERMLSGGGPTGGKVVLRDGVTVPERVAIIHCVGSRDQKYHEYCSRVCCMYSLKLAHLIKHKTHAEIYNFYIDIRAPGKMYEEFYHRLLDEGVKFIRGKVAQVTPAVRSEAEVGRLVVQAEDTLIGHQQRIPVDMVVLSIGLEPRYDSGDVARLFGISTDADGWFKEKHPKLDPVATMTEGVFIAGCAQGPRDIPDSVAQGSAAAARVLSLIRRGEVEIEAATAIVDDMMCVGCGQCIPTCPYTAIEFVEERGVAHVIEALCKGCGTCTATCPSKAITLRHFTDRQLVTEMLGAMYAMRAQEAVER